MDRPPSSDLRGPDSTEEESVQLRHERRLCVVIDGKPRRGTSRLELKLCNKFIGLGQDDINVRYVFDEATERTHIWIYYESGAVPEYEYLQQIGAYASEWLTRGTSHRKPAIDTSPAHAGHHSMEPPTLATYLAYLALPKRDRDPIIGDLREEYVLDVLPKFGKRKADLWYCWQVIHSIWPETVSRVGRFVAELVHHARWGKP
jgi:hypothetical protein